MFLIVIFLPQKTRMAVYQRSCFCQERGRDPGQSLLDHADQRGSHGHAQVQDATRNVDADGAAAERWKDGTWRGTWNR